MRKGFANVAWRTPGADGGRDLDADANVTDISGFTRLERWHIECKRYTAAIDWPTLREKIAYAENHDADYLLICTTSSLSTTCRDELERRARRGTRPVVRAWEGAALEHLLLHDSALLAKYRLSNVTSREALVLPLLWHVAKAVQADYGARTATSRTSDRALELSAALAELAVVAVDDQDRVRKIHPTQPSRDLYGWVDFIDDASLARYDSYALRALLTATRFMTGVDRLRLKTFSSKAALEIGPIASAPQMAFLSILNAIALATDSECQFNDKALSVTFRSLARARFHGRS